MTEIHIENYPMATVACFDATTGKLPRRQLDVPTNNRFLERLAAHQVPAVLIGASTGQGHLRSPEELDQWFASTREADLGNTIKIALLRPEDGEEWHRRHVATLTESNFKVAFVRPGTNLSVHATDEQVVGNMNSAMKAVAEANLALGVYSIPDVSGVPLRPDAVAPLLQEFGDHLVAIKVTEADFESSTRRFLADPRLERLKIVQGWDPFLSAALQANPSRCGVTSGPMSFALFQYLHILHFAQLNDWREVQRAQQAVTALFQSMQDDPEKFADLQRAKYIMGLGHPLEAEISQEQTERVFATLERLPEASDRNRLAASLNLMEDGPFASRLVELQQENS